MPSNRHGKAWYRSSKYKHVMGPEELGDGSTVQVTDQGDGVFCVRRTYPWGFVQEVTHRQLPSGETKYIDIGPGPASPVKSSEERAKKFEQALQNGEVRITARGAIPGQGISNTYDEATRKHYTQSAEFEREFDQMHLSRAMQSDHSTMHQSSPPAYSGAAGQVETFSVDRPDSLPPTPRRR